MSTIRLSAHPLGVLDMFRTRTPKAAWWSFKVTAATVPGGLIRFEDEDTFNEPWYATKRWKKDPTIGGKRSATRTVAFARQLVRSADPGISDVAKATPASRFGRSHAWKPPPRRLPQSRSNLRTGPLPDLPGDQAAEAALRTERAAQSSGIGSLCQCAAAGSNDSDPAAWW
jgi:hypothetical protein